MIKNVFRGENRTIFFFLVGSVFISCIIWLPFFYKIENLSWSFQQDEDKMIPFNGGKFKLNASGSGEGFLDTTLLGIGICLQDSGGLQQLP